MATKKGILEKLKKLVYDAKTSEIKKVVHPSSKLWTGVSDSSGNAWESGVTESTTRETNYQTISLVGVPILRKTLGGIVTTTDTRYGSGDDGPIPSRDVHTKETSSYGDSSRKVNVRELVAHLVKTNGRILGIPFKRVAVSIDLPKDVSASLANKWATSWYAYGSVRGGSLYLREGEKVYNALQNKRTQEKEETGDLTSRVSSAIAALGFFGSIFFLSSSITGNAIGSFSEIYSEIYSGSIGVSLFLVGLIAAVVYFKKK